jgi:Spy/CpxP family protein refolding chaperone
MKKLLFTITLLAGLGLFANAQNKTPVTPALKAAKQTKELTKQLSLTNSQITKVNAVLLEQDKSLDSLKALKTTNDKKEQKYAHKLIRDKADAKLKAILTPEQKTKYTALITAKKEAAKKKAETGN